MPVVLRTPPVEGNPLRIHRRMRPVARGVVGRRRAVREREEGQRGFEAWMHVIVTCGVLWGGFWLQFVIGVMYNIPALYAITRGNWFAPPVDFYFPVSSGISLSLAEIFAGLSVFGAALAVVGVWLLTGGVRGRWRMRVLVAGFAGFLSMWSLAAWVGEDAAWRELESRLVRIEVEMRRANDEDQKSWLGNEKEWIERLMQMRPEEK